MCIKGVEGRECSFPSWLLHHFGLFLEYIKNNVFVKFPIMKFKNKVSQPYESTHNKCTETLLPNPIYILSLIIVLSWSEKLYFSNNPT